MMSDADNQKCQAIKNPLVHCASGFFYCECVQKTAD
jgi:hypothetical protein